jgi:glycosyltransferase involved in cell wall biosynthesis
MTRPRTVVVAGVQVPFVRGGAEWHLEALHGELRRRGFQAERVDVPFQWSPREEALRSALAWRLLEVADANGVPIDLFIGTRFPSYAARHPRKVVWLFHPFRQAYDLHDAGVDGFADTDEGRRLRQQVIDLDARALGECRRLFTTSRTNAERLRTYLGLEAEVLRLPLLARERWRDEGFEPYVLSVGRLESLKRTELLVKAAAHLPRAARVVVVGEGAERARLERLAETEGVADRVSFLGRVGDEEVKELYARCGAVFYAPFDEDYGLVTLEAFHSGKPVVTARDSGGVLEFVRDQETGLVTDPAPEALGRALGRLLEQPAEARAMGARGRESVRDLSWDTVVDTLTAE